MSKVFTLAEAQVLLPVLDSLLRRAHAAAERANELEREMQQLSHRIFLTGGMHVNVAAAARRRASREKALKEGKDTVEEIAAIGVRIQDFAAGLLDFPCLVECRTVLLCWQLGEPAIAHWHEEDEDAQSRRPLETLFGKTERERLN